MIGGGWSLTGLFFGKGWGRGVIGSMGASRRSMPRGVWSEEILLGGVLQGELTREKSSGRWGGGISLNPCVRRDL